MEKKKRDWNSLVTELSEILAGGYEGTAVDVVLGNDKESIEVYPKASAVCGSFYKTEEIVDFCRCKRLSNYIATEMRNDRLECFARIF